MVNSLIVAAPGTKLSSIGRKLTATPGVKVQDLEDILLANLNENDQRIAHKNRNRGPRPIDMGVVCRSFTREIVLDKWASALKIAVEQFSAEEHNVLLAHLTLFRNDRSEYYSTVGPLISELQKSSVIIDNVVALIDDIYDMHSRLTSGDEALNAEAKTGRWSEFTRKSTPSTLISEPTGLDQSSFGALIEVETTAQTLNQLSAWRHVELLNAESAAVTLTARLTVLGIKHKTDCLISLVRTSTIETQSVYISHPISSYRRAINKDILQGVDHAWVSAVVECNTIPDFFIPHRLVAIMPTAIDELRFRPMASSAASLYDRPIELGPRWPLIKPTSELLISSVDADTLADEEVQHFSIFTPTTGMLADGAKQLAGGIIRSVEGLVHSEIPYRDHLLVSSSDHLFVFRPLENMGRLSGGVHNEVRHWDNKVTFGNNRTRLVVLHSFADLAQIGRLLIPVDGSNGAGPSFAELESLKNVKKKILGFAKQFIVDDHDVTVDEATEVLAGHTLVGDHLGGRPRLEHMGGVATAKREALCYAVEKYLRERLGISVFGTTNQAAIALVDDGVRLTANRMTAIADFLKTSKEKLTDRTVIRVGDEPHDGYCDSRNLLQSDLVIKALLRSSDSICGETISAPSPELQERIALDWFERFVASLSTLEARPKAGSTG